MQARRDAEDIVEAGRVQAERMVERTEVAREARRVAQQVVAHAEADSRRLRHEAEDYIDQKLAAFEVVLERTMATVVKGREQLQAVVEPLPAELPDEHTGLESMYESDEEPVIYDQDGDVARPDIDAAFSGPSGAMGRLLSWRTGPDGTDDPFSPGVFHPELACQAEAA